MDELEQARREIDEVDAQLAALFERRMQAVMQVARYKKAHGLPIHDPAREELVLAKAAQRIQDPALRPYYLDHVRNRMAVARQYEALLLGQNRVAYQGVEGAFAHIALRNLFPHAEAVSCPTWDEVFARVLAADAARGVERQRDAGGGRRSCVGHKVDQHLARHEGHLLTQIPCPHAPIRIAKSQPVKFLGWLF